MIDSVRTPPKNAARPSWIDDQVLDALCAGFMAWAKVWRLPQLPRRVRIEFSDRLRSSLGRCHVRKGWIRLNGILLLPENRELLFETLCHEAAHIAAYHLYGSRAKPHGPEWRALLRAAGFEPRSTVELKNVHGLHVPARKPRPVYEYRCTLCGITRVVPALHLYQRAVSCPKNSSTQTGVNWKSSRFHGFSLQHLWNVFPFSIQVSSIHAVSSWHNSLRGPIGVVEDTATPTGPTLKEAFLGAASPIVKPRVGNNS